jgi:hypothetical protein
MFQASGFGHRGDDRTFETLCKEFQVSEPKVKVRMRSSDKAKELPLTIC